MPRKKRSERQQLLEASSIGFMFPLAIAIGFAWGYSMDRWLGTWPWLTGVFTVFGVIAAFVNLFRLGGDEKEGE